MRYIDILIPFFIGLLLVLYPGQLGSPKVVMPEKKKATLRKCGYGLIGIAIVLFIIRLYNPEAT